jgi:hypothetical protein
MPAATSSLDQSLVNIMDAYFSGSAKEVLEAAHNAPTSNAREQLSPPTYRTNQVKRQMSQTYVASQSNKSNDKTGS